ncbi:MULTISPECIES: Gfo/Idh/MocA family oxidoreductase [unclassified Mesorhizobium]|uniref:Gfo/Idh/MocA family protein n=1 Tax=unclassified Mesorhizobium TaxID=325217 RepID=UPI000FE48C36|nr:MULTISPECIES: Gfo/Idh/MocA family oxidoreductase [unclassified Mesorhizobium]RWF47591.1 MAG: Gfo/Idh/MocA family oxidoreductase [Mesorhizobium sp.]TGT90751.1 Gfo/Idh/MocA family oxidoreductase [Mesorhizobium sp. M8A.F.Ca.ET.161.01.1.1]TGV43969.1 Gfo/Idh/MocA family oxidoreductase [Mesorhizobium sp. M8A.F.Ca.ET.142.01.1.1]
MKKIGIGIVGASSRRGWVGVAHLPALRGLDAFEIRGVSTTRQETADATARALGAGLAFDNHRDLVSRPEIDLVVVGVKVTEHHEIASDAIARGKHVYCEWPLGRNLTEAIDLERKAAKAGVKTIIGLQGHFSPAVHLARDLIGQGFIGEPVSTNIRGFAPDDVWAGRMDPHYEFMAHKNNGATLQAVVLGHALEMLVSVLGEVDALSAQLKIRGEVIRLSDGQPVPADMPEEVLVNATVDRGVAASIHYSAGPSRGRDFVWEIRGREGSLVLEARSGYANMADLAISGQRGSDGFAPIAIPQAYRHRIDGLAGPPANVARLYAQLARDLASGTALVPDFATAVRRHRVIDAIERADETGERQRIIS